MRKLLTRAFVFIFVSHLFLSAFAQDDIKDVGISKYAVLEVLEDRTPLREETNEDSTRITHAYKDTVLFADKQTQDYYRVELDENKYAWVKKDFVEVQAIIPEKRFDSIKKIRFWEVKNKYTLKIETPMKTGYLFEEKGTNLDFTLFDNRFDPVMTKIINKRGGFIFSNKLEDNLKLQYLSAKALFGYGIIPYDKGYILDIKKAPKVSKRKPLKNIKILIDPGHGADEEGVVAFGVKEKDINLQISKILKRELKKRGAKVYMTRTKDKHVDLYDRVDMAQEEDVDIILSIHQNSLPDPSKVEEQHGTGVYYYHEQAKPLAESIQKQMLLATGFRDDLVNQRSFALTRPTDSISVLVECGYLIWEPEKEKLVQRPFQKKIARAIVKGCEEYMRSSFSAQ